MIGINYLNDGANRQAQAVLMLLQGGGIETSYEDGKYKAEPSVARWENCREQGYIVSLRSSDYKRQLNIAFFEHRNSDQICAVKWEQVSMNSLTIDTAKFGDEVYKDKYDTSFDCGYGDALIMADWITEQFEEFYH